MTTQTNSANAYLRTKVMTASSEELRLMLLEGAIKFARQGKEGLLTSDFEASFNGISQCRNIVLELLSTVRPDVDPDLCEKVQSVYGFMYNELIEISLARNPERLEKIIVLLEYERKTWVLLMEKLAEERLSGAQKPPSPIPFAKPDSPPSSDDQGPGRTPLSIEA